MDGDSEAVDEGPARRYFRPNSSANRVCHHACLEEEMHGSKRRKVVSSFCLGCGHSLSDGEQFCGNCGRDSGSGEAAPRVDPAVAFGLPPENSGKAIVSLITGVMILFFPFSFAAVIFGHLALYDIRKNPGRLKGKGLAIAGIVLGYLGVAFLFVLVGFGIYSYREEHQRAYTSSEGSAVSAVRALNTAEIAYAQTHRAAGYTCSLSDLKATWGISSELAAGSKNGYVFELHDCGTAKPNGPITTYRLMAYPATYFRQKAPAYCSDQSAVIRVARNGSAQDCLKTGVDLTEDEIEHPQAWSKNSSR
jgi:hypothetical protein